MRVFGKRDGYRDIFGNIEHRTPNIEYGTAGRMPAAR